MNAHGVSVKGPLQDARVRSSETATWSVTVFGASEVDLDHLGDLALARGLGADVWDGAGTSGDAHDLARGAFIPAGRPTEVGVTLGLAGSRRDVEALMCDFEQDRRYVSCLDMVEMVMGIERE
ncbi:hypothetical protein [Phycicoccus avicenniae]|uniref:hypothetical protein n=1 Tax=Phycicoccus avicenniae TaxID=2828860 RepID=UPI003D2659D4